MGVIFDLFLFFKHSLPSKWNVNARFIMPTRLLLNESPVLSKIFSFSYTSYKRLHSLTCTWNLALYYFCFLLFTHKFCMWFNIPPNFSFPPKKRKKAVSFDCLPECAASCCTLLINYQARLKREFKILYLRRHTLILCL